MERILVLLTLALLPLSGCLDDGETTATESMAEPQELTYEPVTIDESIDLTTGEPGRDWSFTIGPEATVAEVRFEATGVAGVASAHKIDWCFTLDSTHHRTSHCVPPGNVNLGISVLGCCEFYNERSAPAGHYAVHFDSLPAVGVFHAYVNVQY